jgi:hypothetical protein
MLRALLQLSCSMTGLSFTHRLPSKLLKHIGLNVMRATGRAPSCDFCSMNAADRLQQKRQKDRAVEPGSDGPKLLLPFEKPADK